MTAQIASRTRSQAMTDSGRCQDGAPKPEVPGAYPVLRAKEFDLLARLAVDAGKMVTREALMADVWDEHWVGSTKTLDVQLAALRRKLGEAPGTPSRITSIRSLGFRLEAP